jgi:hypothetical protein
MADDAKIGTHWQDDELDAIVADYFAMLEEELYGRSYNGLYALSIRAGDRPALRGNIDEGLT